MANDVLLTTPTMLIALLRTVAFGWRQESLAENAREVQKLGAELYERLRTMSAHMQKLQRSLTASVSAYNDAVGSLESRVLVSARRFPALGVVGIETEVIADLQPVEASPAPASGHRAGGGRGQGGHRKRRLGRGRPRRSGRVTFGREAGRA